MRRKLDVRYLTYRAGNEFNVINRVGTAGWTVPKVYGAEFPGGGTHLQRYARTLNAVEINSSFYRSHKQQTYARWAESVPDGFRFCVKIPREITHTHKLVGVTRLFDQFILESSALADRLGPLLVQLPPSFKFAASAARFFAMVRDRFQGDVVCEPRHASWFESDADEILERFSVARVAADPARVPAAAVPGGWQGLTYRRLHGSPRMYYSAYTSQCIADIALEMGRATGAPREQWCIFDNTALGEATGNALDLSRKLDLGGPNCWLMLT